MSFRYQSLSKIPFVIGLAIIILVWLIGFQPGAFRPALDRSDLAYYNGQEVSVVGLVVEEADVGDKSRRLTVAVSGEVSGQVLVSADLYPEYDYGDFLALSGELEAPPLIEGFDYEDYLARYDIYSVMYYPRVEKRSGSLGWAQAVFRLLLRQKQGIKRIIDSALPEPEAGLATAILLGYRRTVSRPDLDVFSRVGLSHMIAISGSHITILSGMIVSFFLALGLSRRRTFWLVLTFLVLYPLITGLAASAVRSAIMGGLAFLAAYRGQKSSLLQALVFAAAAMLLANPRLLRSDIGFQLSFAAILGIIYLYPFGERWTKRILEKRVRRRGARQFGKAIFDTVNLTLVSQIVILPIALINFQQLSLIAPLANVLVLWTFAPLLAVLIAAVFLSAIIPALSILWFLPAYLLLKFIFVVSGLLATPGWAAINISGFNWWLGAVYYGALAAVVFLGRRVERGKRA